MTGSHSQTSRSFRRLSCALSMTLGLVGTLLLPCSAIAQEQELTWARVDFLRNRVQLVPQDQQGRRARISDVLSVGDSLRTARASRAELRFNDGSLARIGERATFRFTPNTRNFQLSNGTILLLIPPGRGRSTIQTPNAVTGIQGSALFVRYIPETDTTIVGALTNNPNGPMVLFNRDGTEQQALRANEIGVIQGDQITELYEFDGTLFWQSSGLAEGFNYLSDSSTGSDALDGVRQEIREAISTQGRISGDRVITNPETFTNPSSDLPEEVEADDVPAPVFEDSPAQEYLESSAEPVDEASLEVGVRNNLNAVSTEEDIVADSGEENAGVEASDGESAGESTGESTNESTAGENAAQDADNGGVTAQESPASGSPASESDEVDSDLVNSEQNSTPDTGTTGENAQPDAQPDAQPNPTVPVTDTLDIEAGDETENSEVPGPGAVPTTPNEGPNEGPAPNEGLTPNEGTGTSSTELPPQEVAPTNLEPSLAPTMEPSGDIGATVGDESGSISAPPEAALPPQQTVVETVGSGETTTALGGSFLPDEPTLLEDSTLPDVEAPIESPPVSTTGLPNELDTLDEFAGGMEMMSEEMESMDSEDMDSSEMMQNTALGTPVFGEDAP